MELTERKGAKEEWKLPKNVRQIGEPGQELKVLVEDYAYTYLHQLAEGNLTCMKTAVLVGRTEGEARIYIQGALEIDMGQDQRKWFSNDHWRDIFSTIEEWFEGMEVVGWFLSNPGFPASLTEEVKSLHSRHFPADKHLFFQMDVLESEEVFYARTDSGTAPLPGYYIYYEKNEPMQAYMSKQKGGAGIETEGVLKDRAAIRFRSVMQEKKEQTTQKKTVAFLYTACTFLVMVILVIGVTMMNNYDRMASMETTLHRISESLGEEDSQEALEEAAKEENRQALEAGETAAANADVDQAAADAQPDGEAAGEAGSDATQAQDEPDVPENAESGDGEAADGTADEAAKEEEAQQPVRYEVRTGDTLLGICRARYGSEDRMEEICRLNGLDDSDKIYVGQIIELP
ncbi:MAG: LysM domain-containing protein [Eubacteriales bacterium]|nr:LysM domain-containing protein [Eubacteriales bacterium]